MNRKILQGLLCLLCCVVASTLFETTIIVRGEGIRPAAILDITGTVVGVGGRFGGRTRPFRLIVDNYTSPEDVQRLNRTLQSGGQEALLSTLRGMNAGRIVIGNGVGVQCNAIISTPQEDGTKLIVLYERNLRFFEVRYGSRSEDYKFGYAEIYLKRRGDSEGTFIPAARIRLRDGNTWEVEDFGEFPARLLGLRTYRDNSRRR
jgi:hypothetical protein